MLLYRFKSYNIIEWDLYIKEIQWINQGKLSCIEILNILSSEHFVIKTIRCIFMYANKIYEIIDRS